MSILEPITRRLQRVVIRINALADLTGTDVTKKITLGARNKAKLTEEQLAIATAKGWTLG